MKPVTTLILNEEELKVLMDALMTATTSPEPTIEKKNDFRMMLNGLAKALKEVRN